MILMFLTAGAVALGLVIGWSWFFDHSRRREVITQLAAKREAEAKKRAEADAAAEVQPYVSTPSSSPEGPRVSLGDMAKEGRAGASDTDVPKEPVTIPLPLEPNAPDVQQADELLKKYTKATKWEEKVAYVYQPERTRVLMQQFYEVQRGGDPVFGALLNRGHYRLDGTEILHFTYSCNRPGDVLELAMRRSSDGRFVIDWTSYVGFSEVAWADFKKERPSTASLFRGFATVSDYYNYEFTDRQRYLSVSLLSPDGLVSLHGYCVRETPMGTALASVLGSSTSMRGVVLRLAFPERAESDHCVLIRQFVSDRWLMLP